MNELWEWLVALGVPSGIFSIAGAIITHKLKAKEKERERKEEEEIAERKLSMMLMMLSVG